MFHLHILGVLDALKELGLDPLKLGDFTLFIVTFPLYL
jgi:hypothetical protein